MQQVASAHRRLRLADLLVALSVTTDLGRGHPPEEAIRACLLATGLARRMRLAEHEVADVYFTALLQHLGCTAYAHEEALLFGGDEIAARLLVEQRDLGRPSDALSFLLLDLAREQPPLRRAAVVVGALARLPGAARELYAAPCEVAAGLARRLGLAPPVQQGLSQTFERWDGKGAPQRLVGANIALAARFTQVAAQAVVFDRLGGAETAVALVRRRAGTALDPAVVEAFVRHGPALLAALAGEDPCAAALAAEPEPHRWIDDTHVDEVARAFADAVDLKVPCMRGHSAGVAELAAGAARRLRLSEVDVVALRRAAWLRDLGRVGVPNGVWEKPGQLTMGEWERVRLHPYHTERILARSAVLAPLASLAGMHHERLDGSGYHRQAAAAVLPIGARILAAADVYQAMTQERPYRAARAPAAAASELTGEVARGRLDGDAVGAVLGVVGQEYRPVRRRAVWPAGLSDREVEVLRLVARGASNREMAKQLSISPKTADHHVQHIYTKIDVSTRAAAAMFAMEHRLLS